MRTLLRTLAGVVVVAAVGFLWAHYGLKRATSSPPPLTRQASVAAFRVRFPSDWRRQAAPSDAPLSLTDELALRSTPAGGGQLIIGVAHPTQPGAVPAGLQAVAGHATPQIVTLGGLDYYRYLDLTPAGQHASESIYLLPATLGTVTAVCSSPTPSRTFAGTCERVLATLRLSAGSALSLHVEPGYALALNRILDQLNSVRRAAGTGLASGDVKTRARAASTLAGAHAQAASAADHLGGVQPSAANPALVAALNANAAAYRALARAAGRQDVPAYRRAQTQLTAAQRALTAAFAQLRRLGYRVR